MSEAAGSRRPVLWWSAVVTVLTAVAAVVGVGAWSNRHGDLLVEAAPGRPVATVVITPAGIDGSDDTDQMAAEVAGVLDSFATDPRLGTVAGIVSDAETGRTLWSVAPDSPQRPASATKILTAAAALLSLPLDHRVGTSVVAASDPSGVVLVGDGDVTLSSDGAGHYAGAASLSELAAATLDARSGAAPTSVQVDTRAWSGESLNPAWADGDVDGGFIAPMQPVMVDGARLAPETAELHDPPRSWTPALDAGRAFADALAELAGVDPAGIAVSVGDGAAGTESTGAELARVESAPLRERLEVMLTNSDNVLAEAIAREAAQATETTGGIAATAGITAESTAAATLDILSAHGLDVTGVQLFDGSGMAGANRISPAVLDGILVRAAAPAAGADEVTRRLRPLLGGLAIAGGTGTLSDRFSSEAAVAGVGQVRAKTGTLDGTSALAGVSVTAGGDILLFAVIANDADVTAARQAQDELATALTQVS